VAVDSAAEMLGQLESAHAPSCTEATWRFLGLSFAGWNAIISVVLAILGTTGVVRAYGSSTASQ
jgi:disulfide bond formation protein DsbB